MQDIFKSHRKGIRFLIQIRPSGLHPLHQGTWRKGFCRGNDEAQVSDNKEKLSLLIADWQAL